MLAACKQINQLIATVDRHDEGKNGNKRKNEKKEKQK